MPKIDTEYEKEPFFLVGYKIDLCSGTKYSNLHQEGTSLHISFGETAKYSIKHFSLEESLYAKSDTAKYPS